MLLTLLSNDHVVSTFDMMVVEKQSFGLHSLHPQAISEGMQILIAGDGFHVGCVARLFNGSTLSTEILSEELLRVHVPSLPVGTWDVIVVSPLDFRNETLSVVVGHSPQIFSLQPTAVRLSSAAHVTVAGQGFLRIHTICVIDGENAVRTVWISGTQVVCFVPQLLPGMHSVSVGHNNVQQSTAVVFEVIGRTTVSKMAPSELVVRSFKGSSAITLIGSGFMRNMIFMVNELGCFSEFLSSESVRLFTPSNLIDGTCELSASIDGDRLTLLKFELTTLEIEALLPVVLASNVMQVVTVSGQFSRFEGLVFCLESLSNATQSFHVECIAPTMLSLDRAEIIINIASGYHCIFASLRNQDAEFGRSLSFCGIRSVMSIITTIVPSQGFAHEANTLTIRGQNFISGKAYDCIFGRNAS